MSTFAFFLVSILIGSLLAVCAYLGDRVIKLEKRVMHYATKARSAEAHAVDLRRKLDYLEAF